MKVKVDKDLCIGCELCVQVAEDIFDMNEDKAEVTGEVTEENEDDVRDAADSCPTEAIIIKE